jgi:hypothetical protein
MGWHIGYTNGSAARGLGFNSHPDPDGFIKYLISLLQTTDLKTISLICDIVMSSGNK